MTDALQTALIGTTASLLIAAGGWILTFFLTRQSTRLERQQRQIVRLSKEVRARIAQEKTACEWLGELSGRTAESIKRELRQKTQAASGQRPKLSSGDVPESNSATK